MVHAKRRAFHLVVVTANYPSRQFPAQGTFVRQFAASVAGLGNRVTVIHPTSILDIRKGGLPRSERHRPVGAGALGVIRPRYLSASARNILGFNTGRISYTTFRRAAIRSIGHLHTPIDAVYGHFLFPSGGTAVMAGNVYRVPSFVGVGESTLWAVDPIGLAKAAGELRGATGFAAVSTMSARLVTDTVDIGNARMGVFPNGVDHKIFFPRDRAEMRKKWGLDAERFLVAFLGRFEEEKGLGALVAAIRRIPEAGLILLGRGSQQFAGEQICFSGAVKHECVPELLSAADLFVLPTESEGCSNATIEAMACGLPVVTSAGAFMDEVVGDCAIRVDPRSLDEIEGAVRRLREDEQLRISLGMRSRERSLRFDATGRAKALVAWMAEAVAGGGHEL